MITILQFNFHLADDMNCNPRNPPPPPKYANDQYFDEIYFRIPFVAWISERVLIVNILFYLYKKGGDFSPQKHHNIIKSCSLCHWLQLRTWSFFSRLQPLEIFSLICDRYNATLFRIRLSLKWASLSLIKRWIKKR